MNKYLSIGAGAALGALLRFLLSIGALTLQLPFYSSTLLVNIAGALLIGFCIAKELKPKNSGFLITGFLGSFTTFSMLSYEHYLLLSYGDYVMFIIYLGLNLFAGIIAVFLGFTLGGKKLNA
ncbi:Putative fluoride ion transporter CrcB [Jeotgalicoccus saudimassiliensis]|uniref:Fluoride-specific ion channel FluC n=1 Tax=Jeotgalicoccus saudimassiliensis TaxID=1461582 RepID=A0A078M8B9_9STAP|nr:CrcB family protein [Jeotgalicoccus saudimassiliensis]CEA00926.1 Putative fluoride ion transporter CrcB [Jeotgalicoccus saudimassiliensis]